MRRCTNAMFTFCTGCAVIALATGAAIADPLTCDATFDGEVSNVWQVADNWDGNVAPTSSHNACIPKTFTVVIDDAAMNNAVAKALWIDADATDRGKVIVENGKTLTLYEDSYVDGDAELYANTQMIIAGDLTINGRGGTILGFERPHIVDAGGGEVLTIRKSGSACTENDEGTNCRGESLVVGGTHLDIEVEFVNDRAHVVAFLGSANEAVRLQTNPKSGNGYWIAEDGGELEVWDEVTGGGTWVLVDLGSRIQILHDCTNLTGDVTIRGGSFDVDADFETLGNLIFQAVGPSDTYDPEIEVKFGNYFQCGS